MPHFRGWDRVRLDGPAGCSGLAVAPVIISASRATDIPAFYAEWFAQRLEAGFVRRPNPFNPRQVELISFARTRVVVFWSKDPRPLLPLLPGIGARGIASIIQFTLNDYVQEALEPRLPPVAVRLATFRRLADLVGPERLVWRFDPLLLTSNLSAEDLFGRISRLAVLLQGCSRKLVFSFGQIGRYRKVRCRLAGRRDGVREFTPEERQAFAARLAAAAPGWGLSVATCADEDAYPGIAANRCIDGDMLLSNFGHDPVLRRFLVEGRSPLAAPSDWTHLKDRGQRPTCGCLVSKDIGIYGTCRHLCAYCYANGTDAAVTRKASRHDPAADMLVP